MRWWVKARWRVSERMSWRMSSSVAAPAPPIWYRGARPGGAGAGVVAAGNPSCATASFSGANPDDGRLWVYLETISGGSGARAGKNGRDGVHVHMTNTSNLPVEALEVDYPLTVLRRVASPTAHANARQRASA